MKILAVNAGSSSLKFTLIELPSEKVVATGLFEKIGLDASCYSIKYNGEKYEEKLELKDHSVAVDILMKELIRIGIINKLEDIEGVGHRMLHGASQYHESIILNEEILKDIEQYNSLAPLHNPANIMGVRAFMKVLPNVVNTAVFDTAFHQSMEPEFYMYPVPYSWYEDYGVRKYGFHGTSHRFIHRKLTQALGKRDLKIISCHIGNGASLAAIDSGKVIDTSMGLTPLQGLMMGSRSGDIDPAIIEFVTDKTGSSVSGITNELNKKSGLLGISGVSSDLREVDAAILEGNEKALLAKNMYTRRIANYIAMYNNSLNGADAIVFTAGVGENSITTRKLIIEKIASLNVKLDESANEKRESFIKISTDESSIDVYVVSTDEELMIALDTMELINN